MIHKTIFEQFTFYKNTHTHQLVTNMLLSTSIETFKRFFLSPYFFMLNIEHEQDKQAGWLSI